MKRGVAMFVVLVVVAAGASVAVSVLAQGMAARRASEVTDSRLQARAAAWSATQILMSKVNSQLDDAMAGGSVQVPAVLDLWGMGASKMVAVVSGPGAGEQSSRDADERAPEAGKLPLNGLDAATLQKLGLSEAAAKSVAERAASKPFNSVEELATVPGVPISAIFGGGSEPDIRDLPRGAAAEASEPLIERVSVQSYEPAIRQIAWGAGKPGDVRVNVRAKLPDDFVKDATVQLGGPVIERLAKAIQTAGAKNLTRSALVKAMRTQAVPRAAWAGLLDSVTFGDDAYTPGLVDINHASAASLACVPGITPEAASAIVKGRASLDDEKRASLTWPLDANLLTEEEFEAASSWICTRSLQWRYRLTVGEADGDSAVKERGKIVVDVVIDAADGRPRLAYYREVTHLALAMAMEQNVTEAAVKLEQERQRLAPPPPPPPPPPPSTQAASPPPDQDAKGDDGKAKNADKNANDREPPKDEGGLKDRRNGRWRTEGSGS